MKLSAIGWVRVLTYLASGSVGAVCTALATVWPNQAVHFAAVGVCLSFTATLMLSAVANENRPATSIVAGAKVVPQGTDLTMASTQTLGTNTVTPHAG
jgi:hypothetical protein